LNSWFAGSNLAKDNGFLRLIKIQSMTSFGVKAKPLVPCCKILWHVKEPHKYERDTSKAKFSSHFSPSFSCFATKCLYWKLPERSGGLIRNDLK
jgi:hypothetical protein